ncbi:helix-turn-helix transcriptional regulator [Streptomyces sp. A7024]|uniref:Helix-turn-helix transcriptional regulator n=1 Tax=Streptomyces coryli TaxID=1128680 RepID=A0A6G4U6X2_9ACTN|nr:helix-turn-helix domain-containing protein [Streptomyces coryli]NGN66941.1 helix-turn-helix transcriptional regulator [Streptomyces coryli]
MEPKRITELAKLKAFTHPLRIDLYRLLHLRGEATASQLADEVDQAVSLVSYHLRKLHEHGFIEEAPKRAKDGRERWWRVSSEQGFTFLGRDFDDTPEGVAAMAGVTRELLATRSAQYLNFLDQQAGWGKEWTRAAFTSEYLPRLTAAELQELADEVSALAQRFVERGKAADEAGDTEGRQAVALHMYGFPFRP